MITVKQHYENYWQKHGDQFGDYSRNLVLPGLFKAGEKVLDVGCGDGVVGEYLIKNVGADVSGVDISEQAVKLAAKRGVKAKAINVEDKLPFRDGSFDVVFWGDNIEHLFDPLSTAKEIKRVLKPGGRLVMSCPNMGYWKYRLHYLFKGRLADSEWTGLSPWEWSHIRFFNSGLLSDFFKAAKFRKVDQVIGIPGGTLDKLLVKIWPAWFGMIFVLEVK